MLGAVVGAGAGAAGVHIGALPLLQRRPVGMSVASIRYMGHKDVVVYFRYGLTHHNSPSPRSYQAARQLLKTHLDMFSGNLMLLFHPGCST